MHKKQRIIVSVTNDLCHDMRVHKVCTYLLKQNFEVVLVGRKLKDSAVIARDYKTKRFSLLFNKNWIFYAEYNLRLFIYLLFTKHTHLLANDLDTLLANYLVHKIKKSLLTYDSHEYFTEVPELIHNPIAKKIWTAIEKHIFPKLKYVYTVNNSIAKCYKDMYHVKVGVIRNVPFTFNKTNNVPADFPTNKKVIILQGAGINVDRGAEEAVLAMSYLPQCVLLIIGKGDAIPNLKKLVVINQLIERVIFLPKMSYESMMNYTQHAHVGLSLDKNTNLNYKFSLPNKLFDYIQAKIPVVASNLVEITNIINKYNVGETIISHAPQDIANAIEIVLYKNYQQNLELAAAELNWENEQNGLSNFFLKIHT